MAFLVVLRLRYVSYNPMEVDPQNNTDAIFYNCADIALIGNPNEEVEVSSQQVILPKQSSSGLVESNAAGCTAPPQWTVSGVETNRLGVVQHQVWYDQINNVIRWDRTGVLEPGTGVQTLSLVTNYTSEVEYLIYPDTTVCLDYGPDAFYPWSFGSSAGQVFVQNFTSNGT